MLSMAGLLCSSQPERAASPQEPWWPGPLEQREAAQHQRHLQGGQSPMDSQGNSREAWDNQGLPSPLSRSSPEMDFQYCDPSMSPPLHPSKRHAPNPPPVSNQATKGLDASIRPTSCCYYSVINPLTFCPQASDPKRAWPPPSRGWARSSSSTGTTASSSRAQLLPIGRVGRRPAHHPPPHT